MPSALPKRRIPNDLRHDSPPKERNRLSALETGQSEALYTMRPGITETLITEGLENARASHTAEGVLAGVAATADPMDRCGLGHDRAPPALAHARAR